MSNNKQSSVDWLANQAYELFEQYSEGNFDRITLNNLMLTATEQAKAMHKEEVERAWRNGDGIFDLTSDIFAEKYYKKMFTNPKDEKL